MDVPTAQQVVITQANKDQDDTFLARLQQQQPPVPGQVTSLLLALKVLYEHLKTATTLDRELAHALHQLAYAGRQFYERGKHLNIEWPPLLNEDLERIAIAVAKIFQGDLKNSP
ncbi:Dethiobiotin synthetase [Leptothoe kymatousa]|uniref:Dethiobiotin synthetase n=1 Tax=Leptothoe kymatousa TAU-MAC 1615 TaxID=2364775 RepID=A0ABS5Y651_9CYAN|nr:Dethiobiotin synthetase [Leptothoe kymatousa]MBT9313297.1 Dethiobiotin synthetase [Leptothoe kymatousa TAU-MAC 1615]